MKNKTTKLTALLLLGICFNQVYAQQATTASGGDASGSGGSVAYSVGQIVYTTHTGTNGSVAQGVQQPFEIQTVLGIDNPQINLSFSVYPNPTVAMLTLNIGDFDYSNATYQLFDLNGKLLADRKIIENSTNIPMEIYPQAIYLLHVIDNNKTLKTFKIIKNQ
jgi:hypothetical protein